MSKEGSTSNSKIPVVALQQNVVPDYRIGLIHTLNKCLQGNLSVYSGLIDFSPTTRTSPDAELLISKPPLRNRYLLGRRLLWQSKSFRKRLNTDVLIAGFNLRNLSNYPLLILRWLLRRPTLLWGHVTGLTPITERFGFLQLFFAKGFICYTQTQQKLFHDLHPRLKLKTFVAANSCVFTADCHTIEQPLEQIRDIVYVGRLVKEKKPALLLEAFIQAKADKRLPNQVRLIIVGRGPEATALQTRVDQSIYTSDILFLGHVSDIDSLRDIYSTAFCSVSPGYIGLSIIQSFAFGVPVLAARDEPHSPEVEACHRIDYGCFFQSNSVADLTHQLAHHWNNRNTILTRRNEVMEYVRAHYTYETMAEGFVQAIQFASGKS